MNKKEFEFLIDKNKYQVFFFDCPASIPIHFARHCWIVYSKKGEIMRKEINFKKNKKTKDYTYTNHGEPQKGLGLFAIRTNLKWGSRLLAQINHEEENSLAKRIIDFMETEEKDYPYKNRYSFFGPNCNTYVQWVLDNFKDFEEIKSIKLPWNAFGKYYKNEK